MVFEEKTISSEMIYEGSILNLRKDQVHVKDNRTSYREIVEHNGGVAIAAITPSGKMVLVCQFRKAAEKAVLEVPAGKIENNEEHELTAVRELREETGYTAGKIKFITSFYSSIGYSTEVIYLYYATELTPGETEFDDNESIDVLEFNLQDLKKMILTGEIEDAKTIAAILLVESAMEK